MCVCVKSVCGCVCVKSVCGCEGRTFSTGLGGDLLCLVSESFVISGS